MNKLELQTVRQSLIEESSDASIPPGRRIEIQGKLTAVNAELKQINAAKAARTRAEAEARKARGREEHAQNLERGSANMADSLGARAEAERPTGALTRGEYLLRNAVQMLRKIDTIDKPLPFTVDFYNALVAYIAEQRVHVRDQAARKTASIAKHGDPNWKETWKNAGVFDGISTDDPEAVQKLVAPPGKGPRTRT